MGNTQSPHHLDFGRDYTVYFGTTRLTLDKGIMHTGGRLPVATNLCTPTLETSNVNTGRKKTILTVPSLDTPVCEGQIKSLSDLFHAGTADTSRDWYVVSVDTPFAQARFIKTHDIHPGIIFLSDYADHRFMSDTGLRIQELNLFARAVIDCNENNVLESIVVPQDITLLP
ncbi:thiol peroxidase [Salmonella enterica]|uniref:Thiol peroxidase n=1 Tax=Salmonella enterica TaxID=28901 RepID=A0A5T4LPV6_SALER|nr:redoxin domain-containing protein [Salmonella enterica]EBL7519115.1 thiol peroxidase [Salmonella enterica]